MPEHDMYSQVTDSDLRGLWTQRQEASSPARWNELTRGSLIPKTEADRSDIQLREELRRRGLFNEYLTRTIRHPPELTRPPKQYKMF